MQSEFCDRAQGCIHSCCEEAARGEAETYDPKKLGIVGMEAVKEQVKIRMKMCGCDGKAE